MTDGARGTDMTYLHPTGRAGYLNDGVVMREARFDAPEFQPLNGVVARLADASFQLGEAVLIYTEWIEALNRTREVAGRPAAPDLFNCSRAEREIEEQITRLARHRYE